MIGKVLSNKMMGTVVVEVESWKVHPKYPKRIRRTKKYHVHNPTGQVVEVGKTVKIVPSRPISKTKFYKLVE